MLEKFDYNNIYTYPYLSYQNYVAIAKENATTVTAEAVTFKEFLKYNEFCLKHGFMPYAYFSGKPLEEIYQMLKQRLQE